MFHRRHPRRSHRSTSAGFQPALERLEPRWTLSAWSLVDLPAPWNFAEPESAAVFGADRFDLAGDSFSTARNLGELAGSREVRDQVGPTDVRDVYRFQLSGEVEVALRLDGLAEDVDLSVYDATGKLLERSTNGGRQAEVISRVLEPETYYVAVDAYWLFSSRYRLSFGIVATEPLPLDRAGNKIGRAHV